MRVKIKGFFIIVFILVLSLPVLAEDVMQIPPRMLLDSPPEPQLRYPAGEEVILTGNSPLEFSWWNDFIRIDHFEFRLYKGYDMYAANLIYKEKMPSKASSIKIKSELFENNRVYTWSLMQVDFDGRKSERSFNSFKVFKK